MADGFRGSFLCAYFLCVWSAPLHCSYHCNTGPSSVKKISSFDLVSLVLATAVAAVPLLVYRHCLFKNYQEFEVSYLFLARSRNWWLIPNNSGRFCLLIISFFDFCQFSFAFSFVLLEFGDVPIFPRSFYFSYRAPPGAYSTTSAVTSSGLESEEGIAENAASELMSAVIRAANSAGSSIE